MTKTKGIMKILTAWLLAATCATLFMGKAIPADAPGQYYYLVSKHSDKCAHVHGASQANGAPITLWDCVDQPNLKWQRIDAGEMSALPGQSSRSSPGAQATA
jgi:hypothetical protein